MNEEEARRRIVEAVLAGAGAEHGLEERHADRVEEVRVNNAGVEFVVERHPHVLGRQSVGMASPGFERRLVRYRLEGADIVLVDEDVVGVEVDLDALAQETVDQWTEGIAFEGDFPDLVALSDADAARSRAEARLGEFDWAADLECRDDVGFPAAQVETYVAHCMRHALVWVLGAWADARADLEADDA